MDLSYGPFLPRKIAQEKGLRVYFDGRPCKHGHIDTRRVANYSCSACGREATSQWAQNNPEKQKAKRDRWNASNPEKVKQHDRDKYRRHKAKRVAWQVSYRRARLQTDSSYRIEHSLRARLRDAITSRFGATKSASTLALLGCGIPDVVRQLEMQFLPGMTWDNYGEWHIDHIRPCASFDLTDPEQQKQCFHYSNLQPLWAADNIRKGASIDPDLGTSSRPAA